MRTLVLVVSVLVFGHGFARAEAPLVSWRAPVGCGDGEAIGRRVAELALPAAAGRRAPYAIAEVASGDGGGYIAHITLSTPDGVTKRTRHAGSCDELADSVAHCSPWRGAARGQGRHRHLRGCQR